jgi:hypothetical protein
MTDSELTADRPSERPTAGHSRDSLPRSAWSIERLASVWGTFALICGVVLSAAAVVLDPWDHDGGYFLLRAADAARGLRPYLDYQSVYTPLNEILMGPLIATGWSRIVLAIAIPMLWILANTILSFSLAARVSDSRVVGILIASLFPFFAIQNDGDHLTLEHGVAFFSMAALFCIARPVELSRRRMTLCGVWIAAAAAYKQPGIIVLLPVAAILWTRRAELTRKTVLALAGGFATVPIVILAWLSFDVVAVAHSLLSLKGYVKVALPNTPSSLIHFLARLVSRDLTYYPETLACFLVGIAIAVLIMIRRGDAGLVTAAAVAGGLIQFAPRMLRNYPHYNLNIWPFLVLILALGAAGFPRQARAAIVFVLCALSVAFLFGSRKEIAGRSRLMEYFLPAATAIAHFTPKGTPVLQYGAEPILEFLASRNEEQIDKDPSVMKVWNGGGMYSSPPRDATTVTVLDDKEPWVKPELEALAKRGFTIRYQTSLNSSANKEVSRFLLLRKQ